MAQLRTIPPQSLRSLDDVQHAYDEIVNAYNALASRIFWGNGTPEGAVTAPVGCVFLRQDGSAGSTFYSKESGTGSSGWGAR